LADGSQFQKKFKRKSRLSAAFKRQQKTSAHQLATAAVCLRRASADFLLRHEPAKPNIPNPAAKSGKAAGIGVGSTTPWMMSFAHVIAQEIAIAFGFKPNASKSLITYWMDPSLVPVLTTDQVPVALTVGVLEGANCTA
jgi:hypothetical protein